MNAWRKRWVWAGALTLALAGCGSATSAGQPASKPAPAPSAAPSSEAPKQLVHVTMVEAVSSPAYAPVFLAQKLGYFQAHGVSVTVSPLQGGSTAAAALIGGSAQFDAGVASDVLLADAKGNHLESIAAINNSIFLALDMSTTWAKARGITANTPLNDKLKALKGAKIGITAPGSLTDLALRYMLGQVGLKPNVDYHEVALGSPAANLAALSAGTTQAAIFDPSFADTAVQKGVGLYIGSGTDFPVLNNAAFGCVVVDRSYAQAHPDVTRAVAQSIAEADNFILDHPQQALQDLYPLFKLPKSILDYAVPRYNFARDGLTTQQAWDNVAQIFVQNGLLTPEQGKAVAKNFTNQYVQGS